MCQRSNAAAECLLVRPTTALRRPAAGAVWGSDSFSQGLSEDVFIEGQVGDDPFEARILVLERAQLPQLADAKCAYPFFQM